MEQYTTQFNQAVWDTFLTLVSHFHLNNGILVNAHENSFCQFLRK